MDKLDIYETYVYLIFISYDIALFLLLHMKNSCRVMFPPVRSFITGEFFFFVRAPDWLPLIRISTNYIRYEFRG